MWGIRGVGVCFRQTCVLTIIFVPPANMDAEGVYGKGGPVGGRRVRWGQV